MPSPRPRTLRCVAGGVRGLGHTESHPHPGSCSQGCEDGCTLIPNNCFTAKTELLPFPQGVRIDYILYKVRGALGHQLQVEGRGDTSVTHLSPYPGHLQCHGEV